MSSVKPTSPVSLVLIKCSVLDQSDWLLERVGTSAHLRVFHWFRSVLCLCRGPGSGTEEEAR